MNFALRPWPSFAKRTRFSRPRVHACQEATI
jgi:hypothetical protein